MLEEKICPYPGLRPFNDDESIFFRGRERNIETIIELFEKKKFIMLTGASGDGKSSLVYAGIVPQAKAGLFKAKYNSWAVADFRPERSPLSNLTTALNTYFKFENPEDLKKELSFGFSSLLSIYKKSPLYINPETEEWKTADDAKKKQLKRKAANLLIIADQFEEFFTNTENYNDGIASVESQTVINILLETARTALAEDLPIYIICTMRSDYIGQCAAFRGLPEYIGFSQFFVPRLKRSEIQQVIEEPAQLNGDSISNRLSQRLLFDITDGYDQLPILQHALNQIWEIAGKGAEEMDLLHYAKVGGLPSNELPENDKEKFAAWFEQLPPFKKQLFVKPSLENILNAHADELLEVAYKSCQEKDSEITLKINQEDAKQIIKNTFQCLTKIDDSRAVRNRMTLQEITDILNNPRIEVKTVGKVLDIFREQGNTFIKPFITGDPSTLRTHRETILDITHESLIRNWDILKIWAQEEYDNWLNFQDFNKQLQRWISSNKDKGYLLPIGPLTFFENWYNSCKPNKYWLARYDESDETFEEKLKKSSDTLNQADDFLKKSARKLFFSRSILKYGANKMLAYFGVFLLICFCTFYSFDFKRKQNGYVIQDITEKGLKLLHSNQVKEEIKAKFLINYEQLNPGSAEQVLNNLNCDTLGFDIAKESFFLLENYNSPIKTEPNPLLMRLLVYMDSALTVLENKSTKLASKDISRTNNFLKICAYIKYNKTNSFIERVIKKHVDFLEKYIAQSLENAKNAKTEQLNTSTELLLSLSDCKAETVNKILEKVSPFLESGKDNFNTLYPKAEKTIVSWNGYLSHKGGYQILAYLYASKGDFTNLNRCTDSITKNNSEYKNYFNENIFDIIGYLVKYEHLSSGEFDVFLKNYFRYSLSDKNNFIDKVMRSLFSKDFEIHQAIDGTFPYNMNLISFFAQSYKLDFLWDTQLQSILSANETSSDKLNLNVALYYKRRGIVAALFNKDTLKANEHFEKALNFYKKLKPDFLAEDFIFYEETGQLNSSAEKIKNSTAFLFPTQIRQNGFKPLYYMFSANSDESIVFPFFDYLISTKQMSLFKSEDDLRSLEIFIYQYLYLNKYNDFGLRNKLTSYNYFYAAIDIISKSENADKLINKNFVAMVQIDKAFEEGDTAKAYQLYSASNLEKNISKDFQTREMPRAIVNIQLLINLTKNLAVSNRQTEAFKMLQIIEKGWDKRNALIDICYSLQESGSVETTFLYLDTLYKDIEKSPKFGMKLFRALGLIGGQPLYNVAMNTYKEIDDKLKPRALNNFIRGIATSGSYYKAYSYIPKYVSRVNELELYSEILHAEIVTRMSSKNKTFEKYWDNYEKQNYGAFIPQNYEFEREHFDRFAD